MRHPITTIDQRPVSDQPLPTAFSDTAAVDRAEGVPAMRTAEQILADAHTVAVVGASRNPANRAHWAPRMLQEQGWRVIPVNPHAEEVFGRPAYARLADVPERVDLVVVFGSSYDTADVARQAARIGANALWLQPGLRSPQARHIARATGMDYVEGRCVGTERAVAGIVHGGYRPANPVYRGIVPVAVHDLAH